MALPPIKFKSAFFQTFDTLEARFLLRDKVEEFITRSNLLDLPTTPSELFGIYAGLFRNVAHLTQPYSLPPISRDSVQKDEGFKKLNWTVSQATEKLRGLLSNSFHLPDFNPTDLENAGLNAELKAICFSIIEDCKGMPLNVKISLLEDELIPMILIGSSVVPSAFHRDSRQLEMLAKLPKYEILEIALRQHFHGELQRQERAAIEQAFSRSKKLPSNLAQLEAQLQQFLTKNGTYSFTSDPFAGLIAKPVLDDFETFAPILEHFETFAKTLKINLPLGTAIPEIELAIVKQFEALDLNPTSQCAAGIQLILRERLTRRIISALSEAWRNTFNQSGLIDETLFMHEAETLRKFATSNGKVPIHFNVQLELLAETFALDRSNAAPFNAVRTKLPQPKTSRSMLATITSPLLTRLSSKLDATSLNQNKLKTIAWSELRWYEQKKLKSISELAIGRPAPVLEEAPLPQTKFSVSTVSYASVFFEGRAFEELPELIQRDVLNHITKGIKGRLEEQAKAKFNGSLQSTLEAMKDLPLPQTGLPTNFVEAGQKLLDCYYSSEYNAQHFKNLLEQLPKVDLFYQYVYEMAKAANIEIADWDAEFGKYNWDKLPHLSVQALERCLHTVKQ